MQCLYGKGSSWDQVTLSMNSFLFWSFSFMHPKIYRQILTSLMMFVCTVFFCLKSTAVQVLILSLIFASWEHWWDIPCYYTCMCDLYWCCNKSSQIQLLRITHLSSHSLRGQKSEMCLIGLTRHQQGWFLLENSLLYLFQLLVTASQGPSGLVVPLSTIKTRPLNLWSYHPVSFLSATGQTSICLLLHDHHNYAYNYI